MKKWMLLPVAALLTMNVFASELWCNYKDYFHLSDESHPGIYIVSGFSEPDINLQIVGPRSFILRDTAQCIAGYAHVTVAYDIQNWCVFDIKDGPYMSHPTINASCNGIHYLGMRYDGLGSYSYTIDLD